MNKIMSLIKTDLNITFGLSSIAYSFKAKKNRWQIIVFGIAMLSLIPTYIMMIKALMTLYDAFRQLGQQSYFLMMGFLASQAMVLIFGLMYVMSKYYFSNDLSQLVPLPIKPSYILGSKFVTLMISEYITSLPVILPFIFIYGIKGNQGIIYWLYSFILTITLPILPLVIASIIIMVFMKFTNIKGKKDTLRMISALIFMVVVIFLQMQIQKITQKSILQGEDFFFNIARDSNLLVNKLGVFYPPSRWGALSLAYVNKIAGLTNLLMFVFSGIIGFIIMILLSEKLFFQGLIGNMEASASKGRGKVKDLSKNTAVTKPYMALAKKEIKMLFKTPVYLLNSVGGVLIGPIFIIMSVITGDQSVKPLMDFINSNIEIVTLAAIGLIAFLGMVNSVGATTFSREGKNLWIQRTLPIKAEDQIIGRILASMVIQTMAVIITLGSLLFLIRLKLINILSIIIVGMLASITMTQLGMCIDIIRPMQEWTNPQQAMKQNLNVLIGMGLGVVYGGLIGLLSYFLYNKINMGFIYLIIIVILGITSVVLFGVLKKLIIKQFQELE